MAKSKPNPTAAKSSFLIPGRVSINQIESGSQTGQTSKAKIRKKYAGIFLKPTQSGSVRDNHIKPSENCCNAKKTGSAAKRYCFGLLTLRRQTTPTAPKTALVPKLASAEKHIARS